MSQISKYISMCAIATAMLYGCSSGSSTSTSSGSTNNATSAVSIGTLFGSTSSSANADLKVVNNALSADAGVVYSIPVVNGAGSNLSVVSQKVANGDTQVWTTESSVSAACQNIIPGSGCSILVGFNAANVESASQLSSLLTVTYSDGSISSIPLLGNIIEAGSSIYGTGLTVSSPSIIAVNESGFGAGVITLFNSESFAQTVVVSDIAATNQTGISWSFNVACNGLDGSTTLEPQSSCSIGYVYHVSPSISTTPGPVTVMIPVTSPSGITNMVTTQPAQQIPVPSATTPLPYLVYPSGAPLLLAPVGSQKGGIIVKNVGNAVLTSISAVPDVSSVQADTSNCNNLAPQAICTIGITQTSYTSIAIVTLTPSSGSSGNIIVSVGAQALAVTPSSINFGSDVFTGDSITKIITVQNQSGKSALDSLAITTSSLDQAYSINSTGCSSSLSQFSACQIAVTYAPKAAGAQTGMVNVDATFGSTVESQVSVSLSGSSVTSGWANFLGDAPSGYVAYPVLSMDINDTGSLFFGITPAPISDAGTGLSNVWNVSDSNVYSNYTSAKLNYIQSAPTAVATLIGAAFMDVGHYDGSVQRCPTSTGFGSCSFVMTTSTTNLGVTSLAHLGDSIFISYANTNGSALGQVLVETFQHESITVSGINSAVGKMTSDATYVYAPLSNGQLAVINESGVVVESSIAPNSLFTDNEYPTVAYIPARESSVLYIGTNKGNVYTSLVPPMLTEASTWVKLTPLPLSMSAVISALALDDGNNLFAGLSNSQNPAVGGGVFQLSNGSDTFIPAPGYTDQSAVTAMVMSKLGDIVNVSTYSGKIWINGPTPF